MLEHTFNAAAGSANTNSTKTTDIEGVMKFDPVLFTPRSSEIRAKGQGADKTILSFFDNHVEFIPDKTAIVAYRQDQNEPRRFTYSQLNDTVETVAVNLMELGVQRGDVVSFQLPNWWEFIALSLACVRIGAVANCLMPILGEKELRFMLERAETKVFIVPKAFRGRDYQTMARDLLSSI